MDPLDDRPWRLADAEALAAAPTGPGGAGPLPPLAEREAVRPGQRVRVAIAAAAGASGSSRAPERLWVRVNEVDGARYAGVVLSDPRATPGLLSGDELVFGPRHVLEIARPEGALDFDAAAPAAVDPAVLQHGLPPTRLVRWQPDDFDAPIWFAGIDGAPPAQAVLVAVGVLAERWPELVHPFAAGDGDWVRHPDRPEYVRDAADHVRAMAADALVEAALRCLRQRRDPHAAAAEAAFDDALEDVIRRHWEGEGRFDGVAHPGISRDHGRIALAGTARVREGADRRVEVDLSPGDGGVVRIHRPARRRGLLRRPEAEAPQEIRIAGRFAPRTLIES